MKCAKCLEVKREGDHNVHGLKICKECFGKLQHGGHKSLHTYTQASSALV